MIICSCNVLTSHDVAKAVREGASRPREVYAAKGCTAQCGNCVAGLREVMRSMTQSMTDDRAEGPVCGRGRCPRITASPEQEQHLLLMHPSESRATLQDVLTA